ncbi:hypothetical protein LINPERHAP1_LOCUS13712, partial [Linum perenne]
WLLHCLFGVFLCIPFPYLAPPTSCSKNIKGILLGPAWQIHIDTHSLSLYNSIPAPGTRTCTECHVQSQIPTLIEYPLRKKKRELEA